MLKPTLAKQGYFLACICRPEQDLAVEGPGSALRFETTIENILPLSSTVALVQVAIPSEFDYHPGQFITLIREDGLARSYSLSSTNDPSTISLHIRRIPGGRFSEWIHREARPGTPVAIQGPSGQCFYEDIPADQPILLAGTGTGLAPLVGILRDAIGYGHTGPVWLYHGALDPNGLYLRDMLDTVNGDYENIHYVPSVLHAPEQEDSEAGSQDLAVGKLDELILKNHPDIKDFRAYLCGDPEIVNTLRTKLFLAGVPSKEIYADPFVASP